MANKIRTRKAALVKRALRDKKFLDQLLKDLIALRNVLKKSLLKHDKKLIKGMSEWINYLRKLKKLKGSYAARMKSVKEKKIETPDVPESTMWSIKLWPIT